MAYRNGIVADALRKAGQPYSIIFGLQLPQLSEIARKLEPSVELGRALWSDKNVRESRLLAAWVFPKDKLSAEEALEMVTDIQTREESDILAFRLLRYLPFASSLMDKLLNSKSILINYTGIALKRNLEKP